MAYTSENLSLAALELFVHADEEDEPHDLIAIQAEIPIEEASAKRAGDDWMKKLPKDWRFHHETSRSLGEAWIRANESFAILVPSVVIDVEWNVLLNPAHEDAARLNVVQKRPFRFDERMFRKTR